MTNKYYSSVTYEDLIEAINSPYHYDDHEKLIYLVYQIGRHFSVNVDNWVKVLDSEQQLYLQDQAYTR